jgi:FkbH-like protein
MTLGVVSDFNSDIFSRLLQNDKDMDISVISFPFGQVYQSLKNVEFGKISSGCYIGGNSENTNFIEQYTNLDLLVVWTRIESILLTFKQAINYEKIEIDKLLEEIDFFANELIAVSKNVKFLFFLSWVLPSSYQGYGMSDYKSQFGLQYLLNMANNRMADNLSKESNVYMLNTQKYFYNSKEYDSNKMWYSAKVPYSMEIFKRVKDDIQSAIAGLIGKSKRLLVLDLDNTLWGGILGDLGWENLRLGGHDYIGEAYLAFQKEIKSLTNRGIILAIVSKNYEENALEAIEKNPEMILKLDDFATWRINWHDKAQNIIEIAKDVNLGLDSVVFIDDNPAERDRVAEALPGVYVPDWPNDPTDYVDALRSLNCFNIPHISNEDRERSKMFLAERKRRMLSKSISHEEWLKSIDMQIFIEKINESNKLRVSQLFNKTNQFNMATRRMQEKELVEWAGENNNEIWTFTVKDKFGDSGLTGIISIALHDNKAYIVDFIMSCRVMGREIERLMLGFILKRASELHTVSVEAIFIQTSKNKPMLEFLDNSGLLKNNFIYSWDCNNIYAIPDFFNMKIIE